MEITGMEKYGTRWDLSNRLLVSFTP